MNTKLIFLFASLLSAIAHGGEFQSGVYVTFWGPLSYRLYLPNPVPSTPSLIVALHGCKEDGEAFSSLTKLNEATADAAIILYPEQDYSRNWDRCWNWFLSLNQQRDLGEPAMIAALTKEIADRWQVPRARTFLVGISAGGAMAVNLAVCYPERFAAVGVHSGLEYGAAEGLWDAEDVLSNGGRKTPSAAGKEAALCSGFSHAELPLLLIHGTEDRRVFPINAEQLLEQFAWTNGYWLGDFTGLIPVKPNHVRHEQVPDGYAYEIADYGNHGEALLRKVMVQGLGHAWSGGPAGLPYSDPRGPDATGLMLDFFQSTERSTRRPTATPSRSVR